MGFRFDLQTVNWLAYLMRPEGLPPPLTNNSREMEALKTFLERLSGRFYSSASAESQFNAIAKKARRILRSEGIQYKDSISLSLMEDLRQFFSWRPWTAVIIPSCTNKELDRFLGSKKLMKFLVYEVPWRDPGLVLQAIDDSQSSDQYSGQFDLTDVFPAFQTALDESTQWPGLLIWDRQEHSVFLPFPSEGQDDIRKCLYWIFSNLSTSDGTGLESLKAQYVRMFPRVQRSPDSIFHIVQLSDIHIGSKSARQMQPRLQQLIRNLIAELESSGTVIPVVTGDLMNSPSDKHLSGVRVFTDFLFNLNTASPVIVLGNHDVRENGFMAPNHTQAVRLPNEPIIWFDQQKVGLVCFNSNTGGELAAGLVGPDQFGDFGNAIDRKKNWRDYSLFGLLHHHPVPVPDPHWVHKPWYERWLGDYFERTMKLTDAPDFCAFAIQRSLTAVLHGHKHIPQIAHLPNESQIPVFGCGSSVGNIKTKDGSLCMSINVISMDQATGMLSGRLLIEQVPGGGLIEAKRHERGIRRKWRVDRKEGNQFN